MGIRFLMAGALIPIGILFLALQALAKPLFPVLPLGTSSASYAGGGVGHAGGAASLFENPGAMSVGGLFEAEAGLMGMSSGLSPYFLFGAPAGGRSAYALGYWYDARPGDSAMPGEARRGRQGLVAGAAWSAFPWASAGAAMKCAGLGSGLGEDGFGIDADLGLRARLGKSAWLGLAVRDALESGAGQGADGFAAERGYAASLDLAGSEHGTWFIFRRPEIEYEWRSRGNPAEGRTTHAVSIASAFFPGESMELRGTAALPPDGTPAFALGMRFNLPSTKGLLALGYAFHAGGIPETGEPGASHSLSLGFRMNRDVDRTPPRVAVEAHPPLLSAREARGAENAGDAEDRAGIPYLDFRLRASDPGAGSDPAGIARNGEGGIRTWRLEIRRAAENGALGGPAREFRGKELPPRLIRWDGCDASGRKLPAGFYAFRLAAEDAAGNASVTAWQMLYIGNAERAPVPASPSP